MSKITTFFVTLLMAVFGLTAMAQAPQTGVYQIQNVGKSSYVKVIGKYDAQLVTSKSDASYITVGIEKKLSDGTYKVNSLYSTYDGGSVEVYDYLTKALTLGEIELRRELASSSEENVLIAIGRMHELAQEYGFMRMMPVDGQSDTYHAIAVLPTIPEDIVAVWVAKKNPDGNYVSQITGGNTMWDWCIDIVYRYLDEHSGEGGTNAALAAKIRNNLKNIKEGHTYMLTADEDGSFGYIDVTGSLTSDINRSWWKLTPKVNNENVKDGTYKIRNIGNEKYVRIRGRYYATPDAEEDAASDIRITFDGEANGGQKIINLGGTYNGTDIDIYSYIEKAIMIGKMAIYDVLTDGNGVNPASPENIEIAQNYLETEIKKGAFMCIKPVEDNDEAVYAYFTLPHIPEPVVTQMYQHNAITADSEELAWQFGVNKVKQYLNDHNGQGGTDNTLRSYILANIDKIRPGVTYYLGAEDNNTFDYYPKFENANEGWGGLGIIDHFNDIKTNTLFQWGLDVKDVEEDNLTSGTYKIRNVEYKNYVEVLSKYYAKPDAADEEHATEIHITYNGKLDDGSYKVVNMSAVAEDGSQCDIQNYVDKAVMLGRAAIKAVLSGEYDDNVHQASPENIKKAQDFMENFVRAAAYMRMKPVAGTNYVYAIATIPEIPEEVVEEMVAHIDGVNNAEDCWNYGKQYVLNYLEGHPNSTLVSLITNNLNKLTPGHTYYLSEDADGTFGYKDYNNNEVVLTDKTIQWGIDLEEEDQPVENDFYKIHNVGNDMYVKVYDRYYAKPNVDEDNATPIAVTIDGMLDDGSMKVTNLVGDGHDIQKYVAHAIELGTTLIHQLLDDVSSPANVQKAIEEMTNFVNENAYMRVKLVPGETDAYYAYVVMPTVPQYIVDEWEKKYPNYNGTMRDWAVEKVLEYLNSHPQVDGKLAAMVRNNIGRIYEGHTYYLRADGDGTFGFADATLNEMDFSRSDAARYYWWGFADAIKAEPFSGYYRIKGADGKYVNVTGKFAATPNIDADAAKTAAGSVIYISTGETKDTKTLPLEVLRSQGVDVGNKSEAGYMNMINDVLLTVANQIAELAAQKIAENPNYSQYAGLVEPLVQTLLEGVDMNLYVEPTITSNGKEVYMLEVNIPDLKEYCGLAQDALSLMGKQGWQLVDNLEALKKGDGGVIDKIITAAQEMVVMLDDGDAAADEIWALLKQKGKTFLSSYGEQLSAILPEQALTFINNALNNPDFNYGTTYCLRQDADGTFGYASRESLIDSDAAKWILEPFDEQDPNYDETTYMPFYLKADMGQATITGVQTVGVTNIGDTYYFTTTYLDFDAKIETPDNGAVVNVYTINETVRLTSERNAVGDQPAHTGVYYIAKLNEVDGGVIPAATPVVVRTSMAPADAEEAGLNIKLRPVGTPTHPAVESEEYLAIKEQLLELLNSKIEGYTTQNAPSPKVISEPTNDNLLIGSFFDEEIESGLENTYLALANEEIRQENQPVGLDMQGVGFWKENISSLDGNKAYMNGDNQTDFINADTFNDGKDGHAPGYIFQYPDGTFTRIENVTTTKEVKSVRYYNTLGIESATPFEGVNIIVTTYNDGSRDVKKTIK